MRTRIHLVLLLSACAAEPSPAPVAEPSVDAAVEPTVEPPVVVVVRCDAGCPGTLPEDAGVSAPPPRGNVVYSSRPVITREGGAQASIGVHLELEPSALVTIPLAVVQSGEATVTPQALTFTPTDWSTDQLITVTGVDDAVLDGAQRYIVATGPASSVDPAYDGLDADDLWGVNLDDESRVPGMVRVSVDGAGTAGSGAASQVGVSWDGRLVVFGSIAANLAAGDRNNAVDIFVRDVETNLTTLVSVGPSGAPGSGMSPRISGNGRYVVFDSMVALTEVPTHDFAQLYLRDLLEGTTTLITRLGPSEAFADSVVDAAISFDGNVIALQTNVFRAPGSPPQWDVHVLDRSTGIFAPGALTETGAVPNLGSRWARLSADGRLLAFVSAASDVVAGDTNGLDDVFLRDLETGHVERVSSPGAGGNDLGRVSLPPAISADGSIIAFSTYATLLPEDRYATTDVYVRDRISGELELIELLCGTPPSAVDLSADGRFVLIATTSDNIDLEHPQGANGVTYPILYDRQTRSLRRLLNGSTTGVSDVAISGDGRYLALASEDPSFQPPNGGMSQAYLQPIE